MSNTEEVMTACDWCRQEALVQTIDDHLWRFWRIISTEDPIMTSHKNICDKCKSRYEGFSIYIERCKINASKVDELLSTVKDESPIDIEYPPLIKKELSDQVDSDQLVNNEDIWKEEPSDPDHPTASGGKGKDGLCVVLERRVIPDSTVLQTKVNNLMCTYCGKTFNLPRMLKIHLRTHTGEKPYQCSHCDKSFAMLSDLNVHLRTHTGEKPFNCSHCDKSFAQSYNLVVHLRTHTGEKPFKCSHCAKSFTRSYNLNIHLCTHTGEKHYKCSHCDKRFARSNDLNVHLRTHTGEKPFSCSHCNRSFALSRYLNRHLRRHK